MFQSTSIFSVIKSMKFPRAALLILTLSAAAIMSLSPLKADDSPVVSVSDAWVREAPPGAKALAVYMNINSAADTPVVIVGVRSVFSEYAEVHQMVESDGVLKMRPLEDATIPSGGTLVLEPGGVHIMLIEPNEDFQQGDIIDLEIEFIDHEPILVSAPVRKAQ